jgi:hypothetical protein
MGLRQRLSDAPSSNTDDFHDGVELCRIPEGCGERQSLRQTMFVLLDLEARGFKIVFPKPQDYYEQEASGKGSSIRTRRVLERKEGRAERIHNALADVETIEVIDVLSTRTARIFIVTRQSRWMP